MYYFLKTYAEGSTNRLRALPNQQFKNGAEIPVTLNIQASQTIRQRCPIGTIFACAGLEVRGGEGTKYLSAIGQIVPMTYELSGIKRTREMQQAFDEYLECNKSETNKNEEIGGNELPIKKASFKDRLRNDSKLARPTIETDGFSIAQEKWETIVTFLHNRDNLLLTGPSGTGKTEVIMLACKKLGIRFNKYNMSTMSDPQSSMLGVHRMRNGQSVFDEAQFLQDIQQPGVILLDEINRAPAAAMNYLFSCCDGCREMRNDYTTPAQIIKVHPLCVFVATANIGAEYVGTSLIDPALDSRFFRVEMDYPEQLEEAKVLETKYLIDHKDAMNIAKVAKDVRTIYRRGELSQTLTVRQTLMAAKLVGCGFGVMESMEKIFLPYFEGTDTEGERSIVRKLFLAR